VFDPTIFLSDQSLIYPYSKDHHGFYQVGSVKTYSKMEAIELHKSTGVHPHWNFNEEIFSRYDWTVEPSESLWELYTQRAWQLRNQYDYLVLNYSSGADSQLVARVFLENNIPIDEIVTGHYSNIDGRYDSYARKEPWDHAYPQAQEWLKQGHKFLHRMIDFGQYIVDAFSDQDMIDNWIYYHNNNYGLTRIGRSYMREKDPHYQKLFASGLRVAFINGLDKPRIYREDNRFCLKFMDLVDNWIPSRIQIKNRPEEIDECFFWSPNATKVICKQAHVIMNFFKNRGKLFEEFQSRPWHKSDPYQNLKLEDMFHLGTNSAQSLSNSELVHHLVYPGHKKTGSDSKFKYVFVSKLDEIFHTHPEYCARLKINIEKLHSIDPYWLVDKDMKLMISPAYFLESA